jgi:hypothetical protein
MLLASPQVEDSRVKMQLVRPEGAIVDLDYMQRVACSTCEHG